MVTETIAAITSEMIAVREMLKREDVVIAP